MTTNKKENILIFRDRLLHISESFVLNQGERLKGFTPYYAGSRHVGELSMPEERTILVSSGGRYGKIFEGCFKLFGIAPGFYRALVKINPQLVHAHFGVDGALALPIARCLNIPLIATFHGYDITMKDEFARRQGYGLKLYLRRRERLRRDGRLFIAVSEFIRSKLIERGFPEEKVVVHHMGIDVEKFVPDPEVRRKPIVLFVGRLSEEKGCEYLIRAMANVQKFVKNVATVIIGNGQLMPQLERMAREMLHSCHFLGTQKHDMVKLWMNRAKVLCVPSVTARSGQTEAFGLVFAESQAMGLPVVSFAVGGIPEAVAHGKTGLLAEESNIEMLSLYILKFLMDNDFWQKFHGECRKHVRERFNLNDQTRLLEEIYRTVLGRR